MDYLKVRPPLSLCRRAAGMWTQVGWIASVLVPAKVAGEDGQVAPGASAQESGAVIVPVDEAETIACGSSQGDSVDLGRIIGTICISELIQMCIAFMVLLCLVGAYAVVRLKGDSVDNVRLACVPIHPVSCCSTTGGAQSCRQDGSLDVGSDAETSKMAKQLESDLMTPKWPSPMQPSKLVSLGQIARESTANNASGMFPAKCVRLIQQKHDYETEVFGFSDGIDRAEVTMDHHEKEASHIPIAVGDVVVVENRSDSQWWQGYVEKSVGGLTLLPKMSYLEADRAALLERRLADIQDNKDI